MALKKPCTILLGGVLFYWELLNFPGWILSYFWKSLKGPRIKRLSSLFCYKCYLGKLIWPLVIKYCQITVVYLSTRPLFQNPDFFLLSISIIIWSLIVIKTLISITDLLVFLKHSMSAALPSLVYYNIIFPVDETKIVSVPLYFFIFLSNPVPLTE